MRIDYFFSSIIILLKSGLKEMSFIDGTHLISKIVLSDFIFAIAMILPCISSIVIDRELLFTSPQTIKFFPSLLTI